MKKFMIERQGQIFVSYDGLLDAAHDQGLESIITQIIQIPTDENKNVAICQATVIVSKGTFTGIGDAAPNNVTRPMLNCLLRMSETRAKARALRDAVNVGSLIIEEDLDDAPENIKPLNSSRSQPQQKPSNQSPTKPTAANRVLNSTATPQIVPPRTSETELETTAAHSGLMTKGQLSQIQKLQGQLGMERQEIIDLVAERFGCLVREMTTEQAKNLIAVLEAAVSKRKREN